MDQLITDQFDQSQPHIYLNHAAVGVWPKVTGQAVAAFATENVAYGAKNYPEWEKQSQQLKQNIARLIHATADEISLVKSTSEALSFVASGIDWQVGDKIIISDQEFPSNRMPWQVLKSRGVELIEVSLADRPEEHLINALADSQVKLLSVSSVMYATGLRLDLKKLGKACKAAGILFCVDAIQSIGLHPMDVQKIQADFVMADGHKWMLGPEGIGLFYCRAELRNQLKLTQFGWHMAEDFGNYQAEQWQPASNGRRFECGSPNTLGIHALNASLKLLLDIGIAKISQQAIGHRNYLAQQLKQITEVTVLENTGALSQHTAIVVFKHHQIDSQLLYQQLMNAGVVCACRGGGIRLAPHFYHSSEKLEQAVQIIKAVIDQLKRD
ncbi:aminotransferase [Pelagibaculum spongiae]|uniref:Aminotransferase n=1 Tax=Pelagibaculum spongiae TaxID=2080658 RepID=A0A2V1GVS2_9GAMM|nr:aminotransferase [Pelagibaculum spongiae]